MLKTCQKTLKRALNKFHRAEDGSFAVEAILVTPLLFTGLMLSFGWFTAFQAKAEANKAAYTLSDYITRQTEAITPEFIEGLADIYRFLNNDGDISLRVSAVKWSTADNDDGQYELVWSDAEGDYTALSNGGLSDIEARLPIMTDGAEVIVVETERSWSAPFDMGLDDVVFADFVVTTPRFAAQIPFDDGSQTTTSDASEEGEVDYNWGNRRRGDRRHH